MSCSFTETKNNVLRMVQDMSACTRQWLRELVDDDQLFEWMTRFFQETVEATVYVYVFLVLTQDAGETLEYGKLARIALLLGLIQSTMFYFNNDTTAKIKDSMISSVGGSILRNVVAR